MTQTDILLAALKRGESLTPLDALSRYGVMALKAAGMLPTPPFKPSRAVGFRGRASLALRGQRAGRPAAK